MTMQNQIAEMIIHLKTFIEGLTIGVINVLKRQTYVEAIRYFIFGCVSLFFAYISFLFIGSFKTSVMTFFITGTSFVAFFLLGVWLIVEAVSRLINPVWYMYDILRNEIRKSSNQTDCGRK